VGKRPRIDRIFNMLGGKNRFQDRRKQKDGIPTVRKLEAAEAGLLEVLLGEEQQRGRQLEVILPEFAGLAGVKQ
jgi:hypothetical protein